MSRFGTNTHIFETGTAATGMLLHLVHELPISEKEQEELLSGITEVYSPLITVMSLSTTARRINHLKRKMSTAGAQRYSSDIIHSINRVSEALLTVLTEESTEAMEAVKTAIRTRWPEVAAKGDSMTSEEIQETVGPMREHAREMMAELGITDDSPSEDTSLMRDLTELTVAVLLAMPPERFQEAYQDLKKTGINMADVDLALAAEVTKRRAAKMKAEPSIKPEDLLSPEEMARAGAAGREGGQR